MFDQRRPMHARAEEMHPRAGGICDRAEAMHTRGELMYDLLFGWQTRARTRARAFNVVFVRRV